LTFFISQPEDIYFIKRALSILKAKKLSR